MSDSIKYYCLRVLLFNKKNLLEGALDRNTVQFGFGHGPVDIGPLLRTTTYSGSEQRETGRVYSYPSDVEF